MNKALFQKINRALKNLKPGEMGPAILRRYHEEMDWLEADPGHAACFQLLSDLGVRFRSAGVVLSPGYSYLTDSLLLNLAGVHEVDPVRWKLPFRRFTNSFHSGCTIPIEVGTGGLEVAREVLRDRDGELIIETEPGMFSVTFLDGENFDQVTVKIVTFAALDSYKDTLKHGWRPLDEATLRLFGRGSTDGSIWLESDKMREWLIEFGPESMSDLCLLNALYCPDRIKLYPEILSRKETYNYGAEYRDTYGVPVYQEQVEDLRPDLALKGHTIARTMMSVEALFRIRHQTSLKPGEVFLSCIVT